MPVLCDVNLCYDNLMKINGPQKTGGASKTDKAKSKNTGDGTFKTMLDSGGADASESASSVGLSAGVTAIDSLLAAQASEDPTERQARKRMIKRADSLLDKLDEIRMGLLTGTISVGKMLDIANVIANHRERIADPELTALLDEIDLRAQIELAKLEMAKSQLR